MKNLFLFVVLSFFLISCTDDNEKYSNVNSSEETVVVLKERNPNIPWIPYDYQPSFSKEVKSSISVSQTRYLGRSFRNSIYPTEDTRNLGYSVVDFDKLYADHPSYFESWKAVSGDAKYFSYANFDRYTTNSTVTESVNSGFELDLGLFSIGNKNNSTNVFTSSLVENQDAVFGELNIIARDSIYRLKNTSNVTEDIRANYLSIDFTEDLYNLHPSEFFYNYGGFVLFDFITGGKATALYAGLYKKAESNEKKETDMSSEINASFDDDSASGNLKFGRGDNSSISKTNEFSSIMMTVKTIGGSADFESFSIPKEVNSTNIDLSKWLASLSNKSTHSIIEFGQGGLIPIMEFIPEYNLKEGMKAYIANGVHGIGQFKEPYIEIDRQAQVGPNLIPILIKLHTRFYDDDVIVLKYDLLPIGLIRPYINQEKERFSKMYGLKIITRNLSVFISDEYPEQEITGLQKVDIFNEGILRKFIYNGTIYIISDYEPSPDGKEFGQVYQALSIHNDRLLDEYAMRAFVNRLPTVNMDYEAFLKKYRIYAL